MIGDFYLCARVQNYYEASLASHSASATILLSIPMQSRCYFAGLLLYNIFQLNPIPL